MPNHVLLNNVEHQDLRVITRRGADLGDQVMFAVTFPDEFRSIQAHFPIVFRKTAEQPAFQPIALFGFTEDQNLFLRGEHWDAHYLPLAIERQPFLIGNSQGEQVIHIDLDSPRVSRSEGEPLFRTHGGHTEYLERMSSVLGTIHHGLQRNVGFIDALLAHDLLESFVMDIELSDGSSNRLAGFYTINEDRLGSLSGSVLEQLNQQGYLSAIYMAVASLSQFRELIDRVNQTQC